MGITNNKTQILVDNTIETVTEVHNYLTKDAEDALDALIREVGHIRQSIRDGRVPESIGRIDDVRRAVDLLGDWRHRMELMENDLFKVGDQVTVDDHPGVVIHTDYVPENPYVVRFEDGIEEAYSDSDLNV